MWNATQYLKFNEVRTRPCRDLVNRIELDAVRRAIDLGCGPGNSAKVIADRWPQADITGLDSSPEMIATARKEQPQRHWLQADIPEWAATESDRFDIVFSNAALQWVPDHAVLFPKLLERASGALAIQMPGNIDAPAHQLMRDLASAPRWQSLQRIRQWHTHEPGYYYDLLSPVAAILDLWQTEYVHVLENAEAVVEWYRGTGLRPYLHALESDDERRRFTSEYLEGIRQRYAPQRDGRVLFPFRRTFLIAYQNGSR